MLLFNYFIKLSYMLINYMLSTFMAKLEFNYFIQISSLYVIIY